MPKNFLAFRTGISGGAIKRREQLDSSSTEILQSLYLEDASLPARYEGGVGGEGS